MGWAKEFDVGGIRINNHDEERSQATNSPPSAQMHLSFHGTSPYVISEAYLRNLFEQCGTVIDITLKRHHFQQVR